MSLLTKFSVLARMVPRRVSAVTYGVVAGLLAVGVHVFFGVKPPPAYGICVACHTRDLVAWLSNHLVGTQWEIAPVSVTFPLLTTIGMLIGAFFAASRNGERRKVALGGHWRSFVYGMLVVNAAIVALGCPTRLLLLTAYGDMLALVAVAGLVVGILTGTMLLTRGIVN